jgi:hypothetical protein
MPLPEPEDDNLGPNLPLNSHARWVDRMRQDKLVSQGRPSPARPGEAPRTSDK